MSVVISSSLALTEALNGSANAPLLAYQNIVTASNIAATTAQHGYPASNLANPATHLRWKAADASPLADEYVTITTNTADALDYIAIARHNLGSAGITVSVEGTDDLNASPVVWTELVGEQLLGDDGPAIFRFSSQVLAGVRLKLQPGAEPAAIATVYCGAVLKLQRNIYVGHTPAPFARQADIVTGRSEAGHFLGRIVVSEKTENSFTMQNLTAGWVRTYLQPFLEDAVERPFFFAWRPSTYPDEVMYGWLLNDPQPTNARNNGMMSVELKIGGVV